jgi:hypothetical protein
MDIEARAAIGSAQRIAAATEDKLNRGLVRLAEAVVGESRRWEGGPGLSDARTRLTELGVNWESWERFFRTAAGGRTN